MKQKKKLKKKKKAKKLPNTSNKMMLYRRKHCNKYNLSAQKQHKCFDNSWRVNSY